MRVLFTPSRGDTELSVDSAAPRNSRSVYLALMLLGVLAALVAFTTIGIIVFQYVTREELRNPPEKEPAEEHGSMPSLSLIL